MSGEEVLPAKVQKMLDSLPLQERQALLLAIDKARELGRIDAIYAMLSSQYDTAQAVAEPFRMPEPSRLLFNPLQGFLINEKPPHKTAGRIWRGTLKFIWSWAEQHAPVEAINDCRKNLQALEGKISSERDPQLQTIENDLRKALLPQLEEAVARARQTPEARRRIGHQLGGEYHLQELEDICVLLKYRDIIEAYNRNLPHSLSHNSAGDVATISKLFIKLAAIEPRLCFYAAVLLQKKIEQAAQLPLWAAVCVGSDNVRTIASSPFAALIEVTLGDAARMAELCINDLAKPGENNQAASYARQYAMACRQLRAAVDFDSQTSDWLKQLSETRLRLSNMLTQEFSGLFQLLRRNVRPLRAFGKQEPHPPDEFDLSRLCFLISILHTIRGNSAEFALNELAGRLHGECEGYLQLAIDSLLEELRTIFDDRRRIILGYADAAIRVGRAWHGEDYASLLRRSFDAAASAAPPAKATA